MAMYEWAAEHVPNRHELREGSVRRPDRRSGAVTFRLACARHGARRAGGARVPHSGDAGRVRLLVLGRPLAAIDLRGLFGDENEPDENEGGGEQARSRGRASPSPSCSCSWLSRRSPAATSHIRVRRLWLRLRDWGRDLAPGSSRLPGGCAPGRVINSPASKPG